LEGCEGWAVVPVACGPDTEAEPGGAMMEGIACIRYLALSEDRGTLYWFDNNDNERLALLEELVPTITETIMRVDAECKLRVEKLYAEVAKAREDRDRELALLRGLQDKLTTAAKKVA
jgi:hypothetical protein